MHGSAATAPWPVPFTLGHETAGRVHAVGAGVRSVELGQPVAVYGAWGCGKCARCLQGMDNLCEDPLHRVGRGSGLGLDGGMAEYMLVPDQRYLVPLPEGLTPYAAAPLTDAGTHPFSRDPPFGDQARTYGHRARDRRRRARSCRGADPQGDDRRTGGGGRHENGAFGACGIPRGGCRDPRWMTMSRKRYDEQRETAEQILSWTA